MDSYISNINSNVGLRRLSTIVLVFIFNINWNPLISQRGENMNKKIKLHKLSITSFIILLIWGIMTLISCKNDSFLSNDPIILYYHLFADKNLYFLEVLAPLFIIIPAVYQFHSELNTGTIKNYLTRIGYKKYLIKSYLKAISKIWILPAFMIVMIFICCIYSKNFNIGSGKEYYGYLVGSPNPKYSSVLFSFLSVYFINLAIHSILYVNLGLLYCKKYSNFLISTILSYLSFIALDIIVEVFIGNLLLSKILNIHNVTDSLNLFNIWIYDNVVSLSFMIIYSLILVTLAFISLIFTYKNKECVIIECEK